MGGGDNQIEETAEQKASAKVAMDKWRMYQKEFKPYEEKYFNKVERMGGEEQIGQVTRLADRAVSSQYSSTINDTAKGMATQGINPNSGLFQKEIGKLEEQKAKSRADSMSKTQLDQQSRFVTGLQSIAQMGQGQSVDAVRGLGDIAQSANSYARQSANMSMQNTMGNNNIVGAGIGAGLNYYINKDGN